MTSAAISPRSMAPLYWLALGTFATGTEAFMIAPLLTSMAADFSISVTAAGQLVTVFALTYALSSPILTALTGSVDRRKLLIASMAAFAAANIVAWSASDYWTLMGARVLLAVAAGLYVPSANALAGALVEPGRRGTALAIVNGGTTIAVALGVPLGAIIGHRFGWRMTFAGVGTLALIAVAGLLTGLARDIGSGLAVASLRERAAAVRQPGVLLALLVTTLWATGAYTVYTYLGVYLASTTEIAGSSVGTVLFIWGVAAAVGIVVGGTLSDRFGARPVIVVSLLSLALAFASLSTSAGLLSPAAAILPVLVAIVVWGLAAWGFFSAQQARLIGIAGLRLAAVVLSLNASFMYLGFSLGAALGSFTLARGSAGDLGWVAALCVLAALALFLVARRPAPGATVSPGHV